MKSGDSPTAGAEEAWTRIEPAFSWDDLVLPDSELTLLRSIGGDAGAGSRGMLVLFGGAVGTGKTMAAQILGTAVNGPILVLDLSEASALDRATVDQLLGAAQDENAVVVFDHADDLLRRRGKARQGDSLLDADALLERCRQHPGVIVFTSRGARGVAQPLLDRFDSVIEFPFPERDARRKIWRRGVPRGSRVTESDLDHLAASFKLPGAAIRTCCAVAVAAAQDRRAKVNRSHLARALELEYHNRLMSDATRSALNELMGVESQPEDEPSRQPSPQPEPVGRAARFRPVRRSRPAERSDRLRRRAPWLALVAAVVAAGVGFLTGHETNSHASSTPSVEHATVGQVALSFPSSWQRRAAPAQPQLGLTSELALAPAKTSRPALFIGTSDATSAPTFIPPSLLAALPATPTGELVSLGGRELYRYSRVAVPGQSGRATLYVLPTTAGTVVADCAAAYAATCENELATMRLASGTALALAPSEAYAAALDGVIAKLNGVRHAVGAQLSSIGSAQALAAAYTRLAKAQTAAAAALSGLAAGAAAGPNAALAAASLRAAAAYRAQSRAARRQNRPAFGAAETSLALATSAEYAAYAQLAQLGYRTTPG